MNLLKRITRPGLVVSVMGHLAFLAFGLHLVGANPRETVPPDAMVVDIVPPEEAPRFSGTPSNQRASGSPVDVKANAANPVTQSPPPPKPAPEHKQQPTKEKRDAEPETAQTKMPLPEAAQADTTNAETTKPEQQTSPPPPAPPQQHPQETDEPGVADALAQMALVGGQLGGGFAAPPVNTPVAGFDYTAEFRERVSSCSRLPEGINHGDRISVNLRVFLNRDGTLAGMPQAIDPMLSAKQRALLEEAIAALEKCQPYIMLPPEKYKVWKVMDLTIFPNFGGG